MSAVEEYSKRSSEWYRPEDAQARVRLVTELADAAIAELQAERDAAWELVEELDPHHLMRNKMGIRRLP